MKTLEQTLEEIRAKANKLGLSINEEKDDDEKDAGKVELSNETDKIVNLDGEEDDDAETKKEAKRVKKRYVREEQDDDDDVEDDDDEDEKDSDDDETSSKKDEVKKNKKGRFVKEAEEDDDDDEKDDDDDEDAAEEKDEVKKNKKGRFVKEAEEDDEDDDDEDDDDEDDDDKPDFLKGKKDEVKKNKKGRFVKEGEGDLEVPATDKEVTQRNPDGTPVKPKDDPEDDEGKGGKDDGREDLKPESVQLDNIFAGQGLSKDFMLKANAIAEAAVASRVANLQKRMYANYKKLAEELEGKSKKKLSRLKESLEEKVDGYLDYVAEQWVEKNELALDRGVKAELFESFMTGMKALMTEHNVSIPDADVSVVEDLQGRLEAMESNLNEVTQANVELKKVLREVERADAIEEVTEGLSAIEQEKFTTLVEGISFEDGEEFSKKLQAVRENFFTKSKKPLKESVKQTVVNENVDTPTSTVAAYVTAFNPR